MLVVFVVEPNFLQGSLANNQHILRSTGLVALTISQNDRLALGQVDALCVDAYPFLHNSKHRIIAIIILLVGTKAATGVLIDPGLHEKTHVGRCGFQSRAISPVKKIENVDRLSDVEFIFQPLLKLDIDVRTAVAVLIRKANVGLVPYRKMLGNQLQSVI